MTALLKSFSLRRFLRNRRLRRRWLTVVANDPYTRTLVLSKETVMSDLLRTTIQPCTLHSRHLPEPRLNHQHHVWPLGEGGPDIPENRIVVCPTGHTNIHQLLKHYQLNRGVVPYSIRRQFSRQERDVALLGWHRITRKAM